MKRILSNLTNLKDVYLLEVVMSPVKLVSLTNISSCLTSLMLEDCYLQGNLPDNFFYQFPNLETLSLYSNENLTCYLPLSNWISLIMYLNLSFTRLSIDLPHLTKGMKSLRTLLMSSCIVLGWNPTLLGNFTQVTSLDLSYCNLGGQIPWSFF